MILVLKFATASECKVDPLRTNKPSPLVVSRNNEVIYPSSRDSLASISETDGISICCPDDQVVYNGNNLNVTCIPVSCIGGSQFTLNGEVVDFYSFRCQNFLKDTIRYTQKSCAEGGQEIEIGYNLGNNVFVRQIKICFENDNLTPVYSHYNLTRNIGYRNSKVPRKFFEEDGFYTASTSLDELYNRNKERQTINDLLDLEYNSEKYIRKNGELFINRGHLAAKGDFVYSFQQLATFHYVNSAPQWATFNGGNWNELEISLRNYAHSKGVDLEVYTGVHGITSLPNVRSGQQTELFLHTLNGKNLLPVPQLFWKVIYNRNTTEGIAVVGINNPYDIDLSDDVICQDISNNVTWFNTKLERQKRNIEMGYTYACTIQDLREFVENIPNLDVRFLLV